MRSRLVAALALPLAVVLAGCGGSSANDYAKNSAATIDKDARAAYTQMTSVHAVASLTSSGVAETMDLSLDNTGRCVGSIIRGNETINLVVVSASQVFIKASASFWTAQANSGVASQVGGKWVTGFPAGSFDSLCNLKTLTSQTNALSVAQNNPKVLGTSTVNGVPVVQLQVTGRDGVSTLSIAATSPHYVLKVVKPGGAGSITFSDIGKPVSPTAPTGAINVSSVTGGN